MKTKNRKIKAKFKLPVKLAVDTVEEDTYIPIQFDGGRSTGMTGKQIFGALAILTLFLVLLAFTAYGDFLTDKYQIENGNPYITD